MKKSGGKNDDVKAHSFENAGFIDDLLGEKFINFDPRRDIYNVTFTFPREEKDDISRYIKANGKKSIVNMIIGEVKRCQSQEAK